MTEADMSPTTEVLGWISALTVILSFALIFWKLLTVCGSIENCIATIMATLFVAITATIDVTLAALFGKEGLIGDSVVLLVKAAVCIWVLWWLADDDWFNRQCRRLKKGFQRIHAWRPRFPALAPAPPHA